MTSPGPIAYARQDLKDTLTRVQKLPVYANMPERLEPPCIVITEGTPLAEPADAAVGTIRIRLDANIIAAPTDNDLAIERIDQAVDHIITSLRGDYIVTVDPYTTVTTADSQRYLAARLAVAIDLNY